MKVTIPWEMAVERWADKAGNERSQLLTDNRKEIRIPARVKCQRCGGTSRTHRTIGNARYQKAKEAIREEAKRQAVEVVPLPVPVLLRATLYPPNMRADTTGLTKLIHDALEGACYENDRQIRGALWQAPPVGGRVDQSEPRIELIIERWE